MSQLLVITRPSLVPGFHLAGVEAYGVETPQRAEDLIKSWLFEAEPALVAVDESLLAGMGADFLQRVDAADNLYLIGIPSGPCAEDCILPERKRLVSRHKRIEDMVHRAIGVHIIFKGNNHNGATST